MYCAEFFNSSWWWIWPVIMIAICFFMMRRWRGPMMCGYRPSTGEWPQGRPSDTASDILDKRYAAGEIDKAEYDEKKSVLSTKSDSLDNLGV